MFLAFLNGFVFQYIFSQEKNPFLTVVKKWDQLDFFDFYQFITSIFEFMELKNPQN